MATEPTDNEKTLQDQLKALASENNDLKKEVKKKDEEIKTLTSADAKNSKEIGDLKEKLSKSDEDLKAAIKEFEDHKKEHEDVLKEGTDLTIKKRQELQDLMKTRTLVKEKLKEFSDFLEKTLK